MIPAPMGRPQDFFPGVGKLEGLGMEVSRRTQRRSPGGVWWRSPQKLATCFENYAQTNTSSTETWTTL